MRALNQGWGYQLDYDKEIATDLREIKQTERHIPLAAALTDGERANGGPNIIFFLFDNVAERAPLLGLSLEDATDLAWFTDIGMQDTEEPRTGWYGRGEAISKRLIEQFDHHVIADPQKLLKKLRARLARHRRNQKKFG